MALRIEYVTPYGITCESAYCVVVNARCVREDDPSSVGDFVYPVVYNGKIYASESAYNNGSSAIGGFNGRFELDVAAAKTQYNIIKQCYLDLKTEDGFTESEDC